MANQACENTGKKAAKRIRTLVTKNLCASAANGGCGECQTSCQSACKTSCGIANQACENK
ncbi:MAG: six-cysteine ranthipeptide SCIFF [Eubacteriales bacterium]